MHIFEMLRLQAIGQGCVVELWIMARAGYCADVYQPFDAIGLQEGQKALDRQCGMPKRENCAVRPMRFLWRKMLLIAAR